MQSAEKGGLATAPPTLGAQLAEGLGTQLGEGPERSGDGPESHPLPSSRERPHREGQRAPSGQEGRSAKMEILSLTSPFQQGATCFWIQDAPWESGRRKRMGRSNLPTSYPVGCSAPLPSRLTEPSEPSEGRGHALEVCLSQGPDTALNRLTEQENN